MDDLTFGSIPPLYREVYDIVCPNQEQVDRDMFVNLLVKSSLPTTTLSQIWDIVDNKQGFLTRNGLYKALALTAFAQQGKQISEKLLENFSDQELPKPTLGDLTDLKTISFRARRERNPNILGYRYEDICELDSIKVELVPEKKGLILKHQEYEVTSKRYKTTVLRRYNDFNALYDLLLLRFPYRLLPRIPPKKMMGVDREFIEHRRKCLRRFINLIARHPVISDDKILKFFLSFTGSDMQHKIKEHFRGVPDEFMTSDIAHKAKDLVPVDTQMQLGNSKEHIGVLTTGIMKLRDYAERMAMRSTQNASDMLMMGKELSVLSNNETPITAWSRGTDDTWTHLKKGFKHLSVEFAALSDKSSHQASREESGIVEELRVLLDLMMSYKDLCDRHEKGVLGDHQKAIAKMGQYKKKKMSATIQGGSEVGKVEQIEHRILEQESAITNMENRNYFSLHCIQMETQLIHANLKALYNILQNMANVESQGHIQLGNVWEQIMPIIAGILPADTNSNVNSPGTSPLPSSLNQRPTGITV